MWGDTVAEAARRRLDPREKAQRRIRRARWRATRFGAASGASAAGAVGLAVASAPDAAVFATGGVAGFLAVPAAFGVARYRRLRAQPLPAGRAVRRPLPVSTSAAYEPMARLVRSERALHHVLGVLSRTGRISAEELADTDASARSAAEALAAVAADISSLESAARLLDDGTLRGSAGAAAVELADGVEHYEGLAAAAARLTTAPVDPLGLEHERRELVRSTERLTGLAAGLAEVDDISRRYR
ncbi:hypothetical protein SAMN05444695_110116 [Rhodococcus triatomae]|uniref:Uncharacterized protein n=1 Tax=Rhodococcus triatomae TaxID=300028 RepID=A0A1G8MXN9_9NOCA|nr:hypothetical protein SAMN05444695_110116 [Rhodococcus triatomae]